MYFWFIATLVHGCFFSLIYIQTYTLNLLRFAANNTRRCAHSFNRRFIEFEYFVVFFSFFVRRSHDCEHLQQFYLFPPSVITASSLHYFMAAHVHKHQQWTNYLYLFVVVLWRLRVGEWMIRSNGHCSTATIDVYNHPAKLESMVKSVHSWFNNVSTWKYKTTIGRYL